MDLCCVLHIVSMETQYQVIPLLMMLSEIACLRCCPPDLSSLQVLFFFFFLFLRVKSQYYSCLPVVLMSFHFLLSITMYSRIFTYSVMYSRFHSFFLILHVILVPSLLATVVYSQSPSKNSHCQLSHHSLFNLLQSILSPTSSGYGVGSFLTLKSNGFVIPYLI